MSGRRAQGAVQSPDGKHCRGIIIHMPGVRPTGQDGLLLGGTGGEPGWSVPGWSVELKPRAAGGCTSQEPPPALFRAAVAADLLVRDAAHLVLVVVGQLLASPDAAGGETRHRAWLAQGWHAQAP